MEVSVKNVKYVCTSCVHINVCEPAELQRMTRKHHTCDLYDLHVTFQVIQTVQIKCEFKSLFTLALFQFKPNEPNMHLI